MLGYQTRYAEVAMGNCSEGADGQTKAAALIRLHTRLTQDQ